jgi:hypothetical protein
MAGPSVADSLLPELSELQDLVDASGGLLVSRVLAEVSLGAKRLPIVVITLGNPDPGVPGVGYFGGVHGLERIGAQVVLAFLHALVMRLRWDSALHRMLESLRLVFVPVVNPGGMLLGTRANPNGVDLMRNAPVDAIDRVPFMLGGHRRSNRLPWFRGPYGSSLEVESAAVCRVVEDELLTRQFSVVIDCHSGFGARDRLWFPYAHTARPIFHLPEIFALRDILDASLPHHRYVFEPQSAQYLAHGDLWDYLYLRGLTNSERTFLPLTLEMGSWLWVKKNPRQLFSKHGIFNPLVTHRRERVLRSHIALMDFAMRAALSHSRWSPTKDERARWLAMAISHWYKERKS